jgi:septal ring factor EnvC (AmiA/AmiB activator)
MHMASQLPTSTSLSLKQAAEHVGKDRTTLLRAIKGGDLSATKDEAGQWWIEPAELFRKYAPAQAHSVQEPVNAQVRTGVNTPAHTPDLAREIALKEEQLAALRDERERERRQLEETIADLRRRLDASEEERRQNQQQLTALLTDQRSQEEKGREVPPPEPASVPVAEPAKKRARWWDWMFAGSASAVALYLGLLDR